MICCSSTDIGGSWVIIDASLRVEESEGQNGLFGLHQKSL